MPVSGRATVLIGYPGIQLLDLLGPAEIFAAANRIVGPAAGYRLVVTSPNGRPVVGESGLRLQADTRLSRVTERVDTLLIAGGWSYETAMRSEALLTQVRRLAATARRVGSVCSGAFVLAAAGLLNGRSATTHWALCEQLAREFPTIGVKPDRIFVRDGEVFTSAGVTAGMDLALALVEADHGVDVARAVARWMVLFVQRPGGQSQFSVRLAYPVPPDSILRKVLDEITANPAGDHSVQRLAQRAAMSERHLARLFVAETGITPARFVERVRVEAARAMVEAGSTPIETIAEHAGFGSAETMRRAFLRVLGVVPAEYRNRFGGTQLRIVDDRAAI